MQKFIFPLISLISMCYRLAFTETCTDPVCDSINWVIIMQKLGYSDDDLNYLYKGQRIDIFSVRCNIDTFPEEIGNLTALQKLTLGSGRLDLTNCSMKYLPSSIGNLTKLEYLDLSNNQLVELPPEIGRLVNLKQLYLQRNNLTTLPDSIVNITGLDRYLDLARYKFDMDWNHICSLPPEVGKWVDITYSGGAYDGENYESYDKKGAWKIGQCKDCPEGQMTCETSIDTRNNNSSPRHQHLPASGYLFDLRGNRIQSSPAGPALGALPKGCYIIRYGGAAVRYGRYVVP